MSGTHVISCFLKDGVYHTNITQTVEGDDGPYYRLPYATNSRNDQKMLEGASIYSIEHNRKTERVALVNRELKQFPSKEFGSFLGDCVASDQQIKEFTGVSLTVTKLVMQCHARGHFAASGFPTFGVADDQIKFPVVCDREHELKRLSNHLEFLASDPVVKHILASKKRPADDMDDVIEGLSKKTKVDHESYVDLLDPDTGAADA